MLACRICLARADPSRNLEALALVKCETRHLVAFWILVRKKAKRSSWARLKLLRKYSRGRYERHENLRDARREFNDSGIELRDDCFGCGAKAIHRHHIVPLSHGGPNVPMNIVSLCLKCHGWIHKWLIRNGPAVGVLHEKRKLGPPRLVKRPHARTEIAA